ncbi:hypothetical protein J3P71_04005 [Rhizobium leguminosarum]|uniref:hypothetical protein n=1 Tax=Rhizobium leguminosarum TaxID=384 RepID=UPI001441D8E3|nr:hypothetical protein [Rhizobium leguminosarum]MBY5841428.1 hypothetical protein [Rhizobium leguminosarum]NKM81423.1 hypothetical protein [Rhizobium leguminosarum bv. viciae]QSZ08951.1 hypothetical protein J3P71_04005 [Rhizobium leguminosarum]
MDILELVTRSHRLMNLIGRIQAETIRLNREGAPSGRHYDLHHGNFQYEIEREFPEIPPDLVRAIAEWAVEGVHKGDM